MTDFHVGPLLLRSARSILDVTAFILMTELADAVTPIPWTV